VVVDGSNIATEGRSTPSLAQLNEAVLAFSEEHPDALITVVVDATFGHRIDKSEVDEFDEAVAHNELVAPPAGAIGRGDAFVLGIASKVGATILSNDSFQEFHGDYPWLFDEGRLVGGKPVPNIGWVFIDRVPVKGPVSRRARSAATATPRRQASKLASQPMPVPTKPPPGPVKPTATGPARPARSEPARSRRPARAVEAVPAPTPTVTETPAAATQGRGRAVAVNDLLPFLEFVEHHPVGTSVTGVVESYSSHGAYVTIGDLRGYVPLRLMASPPPRSARDVMRLGDTVTLVVDSLAPARRSVDLAVPAVADAATADKSGTARRAEKSGPGRRAEKPAAAPPPAPAVPPPAPGEPAGSAPAPGRRRTKKAAVEASAEAAPAVATRSSATKAGSEKAPAEKAPAKKAPGKKAPAQRAPAEAPKTSPDESAVQRAPVKQAAPRGARAATQPAAPTLAPAAQVASGTKPAKRTVKQPALQQSAPPPQRATKASAKKASAKTVSAERAPAKRAAPKKAASESAPARTRAKKAAS
jgi:hypothetical protein